MNLMVALVIVVLLASFMSLPIEVGLAVLLIVWGVRRIGDYIDGDSSKPRKRKRIKIVDED